MGRALFSQNFIQDHTVRVAPDRDPELAPYSKWSVWNAFDPDSDDFFRDAEYEAFIEPDQNPTNPALVNPTLPPLDDSDSSSSEGSEADHNSPMAVGLDDPATLIATAYPTWAANEEGLTAPGQDQASASEEPSTPTEAASESISDDTTYAPSTPLPVFSGRQFRTVFPDTPLDVGFTGSPSSFMSTPSPATSVSPLLYNWHRYIAASSSPARDSTGPLTNPSARMSLTRIPPVPRVRIQGFTV